MATFRFLRHTPGLDMNIVGTSSPRPAICWLATWLRWASSWAKRHDFNGTSAQGSHGIGTRQYGSFVGPIVAQKCDQHVLGHCPLRKKNILHLASVSLIRVRHSWTPFPLQAAESESCKDSDETRSPGVPMVELMDSSHLRYHHNELCWIWARNQIASLTSLTYFTSSTRPGFGGSFADLPGHLSAPGRGQLFRALKSDAYNVWHQTQM